jgi:hypothetical protein
MFLPYQYGLEGDYPIYSKEQIEEARKSPDFPREFEGAYLGLIGNVISELSIQSCQRLGTELDSIPISQHTQKCMGLDPAYGGGSNFGITTIEYLSDINKFRVIQSDDYHRQNLKDILDLIWELRKRFGNISNIYCDSASPVTWQSLKQMLGEKWSESYMKLTIYSCKEYHIPIEQRMVVIPISFSTQHKQLLQQMKWATEYTDNEGKSLIGIHPRYDKLITSLRTASAVEYSLDKSATSFSFSLYI